MNALTTQQSTQVSTSKFYQETTDSFIDCQLHKSASDIKVYHDNALLATIQRVADGYQLDGYIFSLFIELMDYLLIGNHGVVDLVVEFRAGNIGRLLCC